MIPLFVITFVTHPKYGAPITQRSQKPKLSTKAQIISELVQSIGGRSQRKFSRIVGCSQAVISRIVNGQRQPGEDLIDRIANVKEIPADQIYALKESESDFDLTNQFQIPIASNLLDAPPATRTDHLTAETLTISSTLFRSTVYAVRARSCFLAFSDVSEKFQMDDLIVIDTSTERLKSNIQSLHGKLCVIVDPTRDGSIYLKRVWIEFDYEEGSPSIYALIDNEDYRQDNKKLGSRHPRVLMLDTPERPPETNQKSRQVSLENIVGVAIQSIRNL